MFKFITAISDVSGVKKYFIMSSIIRQKLRTILSKLEEFR